MDLGDQRLRLFPPEELIVWVLERFRCRLLLFLLFVGLVTLAHETGDRAVWLKEAALVARLKFLKLFLLFLIPVVIVIVVIIIIVLLIIIVIVEVIIIICQPVFKELLWLMLIDIRLLSWLVRLILLNRYLNVRHISIACHYWSEFEAFDEAILLLLWLYRLLRSTQCLPLLILV